MTPEHLKALNKSQDKLISTRKQVKEAHNLFDKGQATVGFISKGNSRYSIVLPLTEYQHSFLVSSVLALIEKNLTDMETIFKEL